MPRLPHGLDVTPDTATNARSAVAGRIADVPLGFAVTKPVDLRRFDFLFPGLQNDSNNLLPVSQNTRDALVALGEAMADAGGDDPAKDTDPPISAAYTYFGQFVDHDITLEVSSAPGSQLTAPDLQPLPLDRVRQETQNLRTGVLELDSLYGLPAPRVGGRMEIGEVTPLNATAKPRLRPPGKADENDLPREGRSADVVHDRAALIGDPRNDENTIIAQLHVAFLHAHNKLLNEATPPQQIQKGEEKTAQVLPAHSPPRLPQADRRPADSGRHHREKPSLRS